MPDAIERPRQPAVVYAWEEGTVSEQSAQDKHQERRTKALRRVVTLRSSLADDGAELEAMDAPPTGGREARDGRARADFLRARMERRGRELTVRRGEYGDLHGRGESEERAQR